MCSGFAKLRLATGKCSAYTALLYSTADEWTADVWTVDVWTVDSGQWAVDDGQYAVHSGGQMFSSKVGPGWQVIFIFDSTPISTL